jgi:hypothetical protein
MKQIADHEFLAKGQAVYGDITAPVTIRGSYSESEPEPAKVSIVPDADKWAPGLPIANEVNPVHFDATAQDGDQIWISEISQFSSTFHYHGSGGSEWSGVAEFFLKGDLDDFDVSNGQIRIAAYLPPSPIAKAEVVYITSYDGTIELEGQDESREGIKWETNLGTAELIDNYRYVKDQIGLDDATVRIQRCEVIIEVKSDSSASLKSLLRSLPEILDDDLWFVSFLSRKRIAWYAGEAIFIPNQGSGKSFKQAIVRRQRGLGYEGAMGFGKDGHDLLVLRKELRKSLFEKMLINYKASKFKAAMLRTIQYVLMSYEKGYFETHMGNAYLALESLISAIHPSNDKGGSNRLLDSVRFQALSEKISNVIDGEVKDESVASKIKQKIGVLNSRPYYDSVIAAVNTYGVPIKMLWPTGANVESELHGIISRRNFYIHQGRIDDFNQYLYDFVRLRNLTEILILKIVGCPDEMINRTALNNVMPISSR